ncbi:MAG: MurR/RpiR family transcriptional regulator [Chloroflexi bacterium]|nr:MurR/RpiR family transcriptional regulator [Chloroflexota bacterium]OJV91313.1 MAG: hypothetical protein BGO39_27095 [Chloroflexi bacterium 54-19]
MTGSEANSTNTSQLTDKVFNGADTVRKTVSPGEDRAELANLTTSLLQRLRRNQKLLSPAETQISDFILRQPQSALALTIDNLAREIGVSLGTISNFCQTLGYKGFKEFKLDLAAELKTPHRLDQSVITEGDSLEEIANKTTSANVDALLTTHRNLDKDALERAVRAIREAKRITIFGFGVSSVVGYDAYNRFLSMGLWVNWVPDIAHMAATATLLKKGDVALVFTYTGENNLIVNCLQQARQNGATTLVITGNRHSPTAQEADIMLLVYPREPTAFLSNLYVSSRTAMEGMLDMLYLGTLFSSDQTMEKLDEVSEAIGELSAHLQKPL